MRGRPLVALLALLLIAAPVFAGRDCDGTDDEIEFGSDASIDGFVTRTICLWTRSDDALTQVIATKGAATAESLLHQNTEMLRYVADWTTDGDWRGTADIVGTDFFHLCVTYDNGATTNDAVLYVNGVVEVLTTDTAPTGSVVSDAANNLQLCETNNDAADFDGAVAYFNYDDEIWTAAHVNLARWQGTRGGAVAVYHPLDTDKLTNEGGATANGTATGTTVVAVAVPVERKYGAMMGVGR